MAEEHGLDLSDIPTDKSVTEYVLANVDKYADRVCFIEDGSGKQVTFREFHTQVRKLAAHLHHRGWKTGDVLVMFASTCLEFPIAFHAACTLGLIIHPVNPSFTTEELVRHCKAVDGKVMFTTSDTMDRALEASNELRKIGKRIGDFVSLDKIKGFAHVQALLDREDQPFPEIKFDAKTHMCFIFTTSGTTGPPKFALQPHYSLIVLTEEMGDLGMDLSGPETVLMTVPYFAGHTIASILSSSLRYGLTTVIQKKFELESFLYTIDKYKVSILHAIPGLVNGLTKTPLLEKYDTSSLKEITCSGAKISPKTISALQHRFPNITFRQAYGCTEVGMLTFPAPELNDRGSIGKPPRFSRIKIVDLDTRKEVGVNETGEFLANGPQMFHGYLHNEQAFKDCMEDGWYKTGDVGYQDESGGYYIVDRIKDVIKVGTFQVSPTELESDVMHHPDVMDCAVIGIPRDDDAGENPRAYIIRKPGTTVTEEDIVQYIKEHVAPLRHLTGGVEFVESLPRNNVGKIMRRQIREKALHHKEW